MRPGPEGLLVRTRQADVLRQAQHHSTPSRARASPAPVLLNDDLIQGILSLSKDVCLPAQKGCSCA